jgi:hypothetical protein
MLNDTAVGNRHPFESIAVAVITDPDKTSQQSNPTRSIAMLSSKVIKMMAG